MRCCDEGRAGLKEGRPELPGAVAGASELGDAAGRGLNRGTKPRLEKDGVAAAANRPSPALPASPPVVLATAGVRELRSDETLCCPVELVRLRKDGRALMGVPRGCAGWLGHVTR